MKFFNPTGPGELFIAGFFQDEPAWQCCSREGCRAADTPPPHSKIPTLAMIPDRFFFFHLPQGIGGKNRRLSRQATRLQMTHLFPAPGPGESVEVLDTGREVMGFFRSADLAPFLEKHRNILATARAVTTPFLLARAVMASEGVPSWFLHNPGDPVVLARDGRLDYFFGNEEEAANRISQDDTKAGPVRIEPTDLLSKLPGGAIPWSRFRLSLPELETERGEAGKLAKLVMVLLAAGFLFCAGEMFKLTSARSQKVSWENALGELYSKALGPDHGSDPYGLLLYRASQARGGDKRGLDVVRLLGVLSESAPESLSVESLNLGMDSGIIRASVENYDQMESFMDKLKNSGPYGFTLDRAESSGGRVTLTLRVTY